MHRPFPLFSLYDVPQFSVDAYDRNIRSVTYDTQRRAYVAFNRIPTVLKDPI